MIEQGHIFTMDGVKIATDLGDVGACHATDGQCSTDEGVIVWHPRNLTKICPYTVKGTHHAEIIRRHIIINSIQAAYSYSALPLPNNARCIEKLTNK